MSQENLEIVRDGYKRFVETGDFEDDRITDDFVWDMSNFRGWPEQQTYEGIEGARAFMSAWMDTWEDWEIEIEDLRDAGDKVVALASQRGKSKGAGLPVEMSFAQVFTIRDGKQARMDMYSDRDEALAAVGLSD